MKIFCSHLMSWPCLPAGEPESDSLWSSNRLYRPAEGHTIYDRLFVRFRVLPRSAYRARLRRRGASPDVLQPRQRRCFQFCAQECGHVPPIEKPAEFAAATISFLSEGER